MSSPGSAATTQRPARRGSYFLIGPRNDRIWREIAAIDNPWRAVTAGQPTTINPVGAKLPYLNFPIPKYSPP